MTLKPGPRWRWTRDLLLALLVLSTTVVGGCGCIGEFFANLFGGLRRSRTIEAPVEEQVEYIVINEAETEVIDETPVETVTIVEEAAPAAPRIQYSSQSPVQLSFTVNRYDDQSFSIDPGSITVHDTRTNETQPLATRGHIFSKKPKVYWVTDSGKTRLGSFEYG